MAKNVKRYYKERESPFFRLRSKAKLASLLYVSERKLKALTKANNLYVTFSRRKASGGLRVINAPREDLKKVQARIASLLHRIAPPNYLYAPVAGRSYVDNAAAHLAAKSICLLDIEDFFPNCTANKVIWFFNKRMQCSIDVSVLICRLVTLEGSLPQGSPCSPILAYLSYVDMWEEIARIADRSNCTLSVYADDITLSGEKVPGKSVWRIKKILRRHGHTYQAQKVRVKHQKPAEITGAIVKSGQLYAPNRLHLKLHTVQRELAKSSSGRIVNTLGAQLKGRRAQMKQITSRNLTG